MRMRFSGLAGKPEAVDEILLRIANQLGAAEQRELAPLFAVGDERVPNLREYEPDEAVQVVLAEVLEAMKVESGPKRHGLSSRVRISRPRAAARLPRSTRCGAGGTGAGSSSRSRRGGASRPRRARPLWV